MSVPARQILRPSDGRRLADGALLFDGDEDRDQRLTTTILSGHTFNPLAKQNLVLLDADWFKTAQRAGPHFSRIFGGLQNAAMPSLKAHRGLSEKNAQSRKGKPSKFEPTLFGEGLHEFRHTSSLPPFCS
jgi:hypothetical protein